MVSEEEENKDAQKGSEGDDHNRPYLIQSDYMCICAWMQVQGNVNGPTDDTIANTKKERPEEAHEVFVVSLANTRTNPRAMVIQSFNAAATQTAVNGPGRPKDIAVFAVFDPGKAAIQNIQVFANFAILSGHVYLPMKGFEQEFLKLYKIYYLKIINLLCLVCWLGPWMRSAKGECL